MIKASANQNENCISVSSEFDGKVKDLITELAYMCCSIITDIAEKANVSERQIYRDFDKKLLDLIISDDELIELLNSL